MLALGTDGVGAAAAPPGAAIISITLEPQGDDAINIVTQVASLADVAGVAEVRVIRGGRAGEAVTTQSKVLTLSAGQLAIVARLTLSVAADDRLEVEAKFSSGDQLISTATVTSGFAR